MRHCSASVRRAFSLVELVAVVSIMTLLAGLGMPAVKGLTGSGSLSSGTRQFAGWLTLARSEAISRHTRVRFAVARDWTGKEDARLRKVSLWAWNPEVEQYLPLTKWEELPIGVVIEPSLPGYIGDAEYARADNDSVRGECVLDESFQSQAEFIAGTDKEPITARFIEFLPSGSVRIPGGTKRNAIFVATQGFTNPDGSLSYTSRAESSRPATWAQVNVDTLTGRVRVYQP